jgi:hypothetical protein
LNACKKICPSGQETRAEILNDNALLAHSNLRNWIGEFKFFEKNCEKKFGQEPALEHLNFVQ